MSRWIACALAGFAWLAGGVPAFAEDSPDQAAIRQALIAWTADFNAGRTGKVCGLFAPDLAADVRGAPKRDYAALCGLLRRALSDPAKTFRYDDPAIREIIVSGDLAAVRLVWTSHLRRKGARRTLTIVEPGLDVFRRQPDGSWKIARFMSFEAP